MGSPPLEGARRVGSFVHPAALRGRSPSASGRCLSPGCGEEVGAGGRFCPAHAALLARVRAELEAEDANGGARGRYERVATRGMRDEPAGE